MSTELKKYMKRTTRSQQQRLAKMAGVTHNYLYHLTSGRRNASAGCAGRLERAAAKLDGSRLDRKKVAPDCAKCDR